MSETEAPKPLDFIRTKIAEDLNNNKNDGKVITRFPPEPNGYLHIGHAKSICLNFGIASEHETGHCHLRFDDTNPAKEEVEYVESIKEDVKWLGWDWGENLFFASDYFGKMYDYAVTLIQKGKAYVCELNSEEMRAYRGTLTEPGKASPFRDRTVEENLELFEKMKNGDFAEGSHVLRAKIDMASPNMHMRDPVIYRIMHTEHHHTGDAWSIYPMYDFAHCIEDSIEGITHSICTLEFEVHRPLYDWIMENLEVECHPQQIEFARLNLTYTVMSKRKLLELVEGDLVDGWDDPRMPTVSGLRRRGYTPSAIRAFCDKIGVTKFNSLTDIALLEFCIREDLNPTAMRVMGVLNPVKVVITNYPEGQTEELEAINNPGDETAGTRMVPFTRELYIERDDFMEDAPKKFFRLAPGREVRLRYGYLVTCQEAIKDEEGNITEIHCTYDPETRGGNAPDGRKVKGTIHWVSAEHAVDAKVNLYDRLFTVEQPDNSKDEKDYKEYLNTESLTVINTKLERSLKDAKLETSYQFERKGYFCLDKESTSDNLIFNRTVSLRDGWAKKMAGKK